MTWALPFCKRTLLQSLIWISISCAIRCRQAPRPASPISRTWGPFELKDHTTLNKPTTPADETACARKIISNLATHAFRRPANNTDVDSLMAFYQERRKDGNFEGGIENALARILTDPKFIYRIEAEPPNVKQGETYRISDIDLASRLSFFLWST